MIASCLHRQHVLCVSRHCQSVSRFGTEYICVALDSVCEMKWVHFCKVFLFFKFVGAVLAFSLCLTWKRIKDLNVKPQNPKLLEKNGGNTWLEIGSGFWIRFQDLREWKQAETIVLHTCKVEEKEGKVQIGEKSCHDSPEKGEYLEYMPC